MRVPDVIGNPNIICAPANIHGLTFIGVSTNVGAPVNVGAQYISGVTGIVVAATITWIDVSSSR